MSVHDVHHYEQIKRLLGIPSEEPIFILRGKDSAALGTLHDYKGNAEGVGASPAFQVDLNTSITEFVKFRSEYPDRMKTPD